MALPVPMHRRARPDRRVHHRESRDVASATTVSDQCSIQSPPEFRFPEARAIFAGVHHITYHGTATSRRCPSRLNTDGWGTGNC